MDVHDVLDTQPEESVPDAAAAEEQPEQPEEAEPAPLSFHEVRLSDCSTARGALADSAPPGRA